MNDLKFSWEAPDLLLEAAEQEILLARVDSAALHLARIDEFALRARSSDLTFLSRYFRVLAIVNRDANHIEAAIGAYDQLELVAREIGHRVLVNEAIVGRIMILTNNERVQLARQVLNRCQSELSATTAEEQQAELSFWRARVMEDSGDIEAARATMAHDVIPRSERYEEPGMQIARYTSSSRLALYASPTEWRAAEIDLGKADNLIRADTTLLRRGQFVQQMALFELLTGDVDNAERHADVAGDIFKAGGIVSHQLRRLRKMLEQA